MLTFGKFTVNESLMAIDIVPITAKRIYVLACMVMLGLGPPFDLMIDI